MTLVTDPPVEFGRAELVFAVKCRGVALGVDPHLEMIGAKGQANHPAPGGGGITSPRGSTMSVGRDTFQLPSAC